MTRDRRTDGRSWELRAAALLSGNGVTILEHGYRCRGGELDLVCREDDQLVIVEVRARRSRRYGGAAASVDPRKQRKIVLATRHYLMTHPEFDRLPIRFDVVAIDSKDTAHPEIEWIRNAFAA